MAGLTSTFHHPLKPHLFKPLHFFKPHTFPLHQLRLATVNFPSITVSARGGGGGGNSRNIPNFDEEDKALDIASIKSDKVRLIDDKQNMVGVVAKSMAIQMAADAELDLVILSPDADPPVVKVMDYDKYMFEQQKRKRDQMKRSAATRADLKELKMGYNIDIHDYSVRLKAAKKFLSEGDKVKIIVNLKGRENQFRKNAIDLLKRFKSDVGELAVEESKSFRDRNMFMLFTPNKVVIQKSQESPSTKDTTTVTEVSAGV